MRGSRHNACEDSNAPSPPKNRGRGIFKNIPVTREPGVSSPETRKQGFSPREVLSAALGFPVEMQGEPLPYAGDNGGGLAW